MGMPNGATFEFYVSGSETRLKSPHYALSNAPGDIPSGKYDPRNTQITYESDGLKILVLAPDGTQRIYYRVGGVGIHNVLFLLGKEILPNGKILRYKYNGWSQPSSIESLDPQERHIYASLSISGFHSKENCHVVSSSGTSVDYQYENRPVAYKIKEKRGKTTFHHAFPPLLTSVKSPFYQDETIDYSENHLLTSYSGKDLIFSSDYKTFGKASNLRVHKLALPVGENDSLYPVYELNYDPAIAGEKEGSTQVKNSDGTSIIYHFSKNLLTTSIQYFGVDGNLKKEKVFSWTKNQWLQSIEMLDGQKQLLYRKSYNYDLFGNPILEVFTGDLTGEGLLEDYTTKRTFSQDGRNLLLQEESENSTVLCLEYHPNTNLVISKLTKDRDRILRREFFEYDDFLNLVREIADDGISKEKKDTTGVTQQRITQYILRDQAPLHMPEWVEEKFLDQEGERTLRRTHLVYDQYGNIAQEDIYDAEGALAYSIYKEYDERGDLLSETNPLGQKTTYSYDLRGHCINESNFSGRLKKVNQYDKQGRLREQVINGNDGISHGSQSVYDHLDRLVQKTDSFNNTTYYSYDPVVNQVSRTNFPPIVNQEGQGIPVATSSTYDPFGRELTKTDANGNITTYRFNAYGSTCEIIYPDGTRETFRYTKNGQLASHTDPDGLMIRYTKDVLGRTLSKTYLSSSGDTLGYESFAYSGFNLLTETDKEGNVTKYTYDGAGRKVAEEFAGKENSIEYDSLGRPSTVCKHNGNNTLVLGYQRDMLDRVTQETKKDSAGRLLYKVAFTYDEDGNRNSIQRTINEQESTESFVFDSFQRLIQSRDPLGHVLSISYNENYRNQLGQKVLQIQAVDPLNVTTVETQDSQGHLVKNEILNSQGITISSQERSYDPKGNLHYIHDHVYKDALFQSTQTIKYTFTSKDQVESCTRGFGSKEGRETSYTYTPSGQRASKTLSDGITLLYEHHPLGFLSSLSSSDGKTRFRFEYDKLGHLKLASDENQQTTIQRKVDAFGNVLQEVFPSGLEIQKEYDPFNRPISLKFGNEVIRYAYDPVFLRKVTRTSNGKVLYAHHYDNYDLDENLALETLIGDLAQVKHDTDPKGRKAKIASPYFSQECSYDPLSNLVRTCIDGIEHTYAYDDLSQLITEASPKQSYVHNSLYNRTEKNGMVSEFNELNELLSLGTIQCAYDLNGNQILKQTPTETFRFTYDPLNQLIEAISETTKVCFTYDPLGRRQGKVVYTGAYNGWKEAYRENYLYDGQNEIGAFQPDGKAKNLRILGLVRHKNTPTTIGVEVDGKIFAPILDTQGNICRLINLESKTLENRYEFTAFGERLKESESVLNPWRYASKRFDSELNLVYFGKRYYDPEFARWLTADPAGCFDCANLYQYVLNNPYRYFDPEGENVIGFLCGMVQIAVGGAIIVSGVAIEIATFGGYTFAFGFHEAVGITLVASGCAQAMNNAGDIALPKSFQSSAAEKRHTPDQEAISELVKESGKKGVTNADADTLLEWANEYDFPARDDRGKLDEKGEPHWDHGEHIHLGPKHVKVNS